jgi:hypothetical protein
MPKSLLLILAFLIMVACTPQEQAKREIYTALEYGDDVFEPELWFANAAEEATRTTAQWTSFELKAVSFLEILDFDQDMDQAGIEAYFNTAWFTGAFANYEGWGQSAACRFGDTMLFEFNMDSEGRPYALRYWVQPINARRVVAVFITLPLDVPDLMNTYAARMFPDAASCAQ